jgi:hypothetical protein
MEFHCCAALVAPQKIFPPAVAAKLNITLKDHPIPNMMRVQRTALENVRGGNTDVATCPPGHAPSPRAQDVLRPQAA